MRIRHIVGLNVVVSQSVGQSKNITRSSLIWSLWWWGQESALFNKAFNWYSSTLILKYSDTQESLFKAYCTIINYGSYSRRKVFMSAVRLQYLIQEIYLVHVVFYIFYAEVGILKRKSLFILCTLLLSLWFRMTLSHSQPPQLPQPVHNMLIAPELFRNEGKTLWIL